MSKLNIIADPASVSQQRKFPLIPTGDYVVQVVSASPNSTKAGDGLRLTLQVTDGPYRNRQVWVQMSLSHPDPEIRSWAMDELQLLCKSIDLTGEIDTDALCFKPFTALIYSTKGTGGFESRNGARNFRSASSGHPHRQAAAVHPEASTG